MKKKFLGIGSLVVFIAFCISTSLSAAPMYVPFDEDPDDEKETEWPCDNPDKLGIICTSGAIDCTPRDCPIPE